MSPGVAAAETRLSVIRESLSGKPVFQLDGRPFYPLIYADRFSTISSQVLTRLSAQGFNMAQVAADTEDTTLPEFRACLEACKDAGLPVLLELNDWQIRQTLIDHPEMNMVMSDGTPVRYFPDYANPRTREEHLGRFQRAAVNIVPFVGAPIVAISVGAYDAYHLPDGEVHDDFVVPKHGRNQTRLPYSHCARAAFADYLKGVPGRSGIGQQSYADAPPTALVETNDPAVWQDWLAFRRNLVTHWLAETTNAVRSRTHVPVGVSLDLKFAQNENFATPPYAWVKSLDFVSAYCYGRQPEAGYVAPLMRTIWREYSEAGVPIIGFLEFSSGLSGGAPGDQYAREFAPFASGLMTAAAREDRKHNEARVGAFINWARAEGTEKLLKSSPKPADVLVVVSREEFTRDESILAVCRHAGQTADVIYVAPNWKCDNIGDYRYVVLADDLPMPPSSCAVRYRLLRSNELGRALAPSSSQATK
jgi:hypothetical protein